MQNVRLAKSHNQKTFRLRYSIFAILIGLGFQASPTAADDPYQQAREYLVTEYVQKEGISNPFVLAAIRETPRHMFVPFELRRFAYSDQAMSIGHGQTISPPFIVAYMTEMLQPQPTDKVLEIGTGSGYQAAVLAPLVKDVYTIEIVEPLGKRAAATLKRLKYRNVHPRIGDGYKGWPDQAPFDKIIVTCSPESVPQPLIDQLKEGGRMIVPLGERYQQVFYLFTKKDGKLISEPLQPTLFVPMTGQSEVRRRVLPNPAAPEIVNGGFETDDNKDGFLDGFHYQRRLTWMTGDAPEGNRYVEFNTTQPAQVAHMLQGLAIDGRAVQQIRLSLEIKLPNYTPGRETYQKPGFVIHYYDENRKPLGSNRVGNWDTSPDWQRISTLTQVPNAAREAIIQIGLNGAEGTLAIDDVQLTVVK